MKPRVALLRSEHYETCRDTIAEALRLSGLGQCLRDKRVLLKINLMKGAPPEKCVNTHPEFVGALTGLLAEQGCRVSAGDSTGVLGFTDEALQAAGLDRAILDAGGEIANLDSGPFREVPVEGKLFRSFWLPELLFEVDEVVSVPKLKTHTLTGMTAAVKNLVGVLPGGAKCELHVRGPTPPAVSEAIVDLFAAVKPGGAVVDGIWGLAGQGKGVGPVPVRPGLVIAGRDCAAVDVVCAEAIGFPPREIPTIRAAEARGLGCGGIDDVEVVGQPIEACRVPFERPGFEPKRWRLVARPYYRLRGRSIRPTVVAEQCDGCGRCIEVCPTDAIRREDERIVIGSDCIRCLACHEVCPRNAILLKCPAWLKPMFRKRAEGLDTSKLL